MSLRYYANAPATTLSSSITNSTTSIPVTSVTGLPVSYPYVLIIDRGLSTEEAVEVTAAAGLNLTVTRGADSTTAFAHASGASVAHGITARDIREPNTHINTSAGVHGVAGTLVGDTDTQTLTNKTLNMASNTLTGTLAQFNAAVSDADLTSLAGTETLTNKTLTTPKINLIYNTVGAPGLELDTSVSDSAAVHLQVFPQTPASNFVLLKPSGTGSTLLLSPGTLGGYPQVGTSLNTTQEIATIGTSQTLSNKTLASPTITGPYQRIWVTKAADESVTTSTTYQSDDHLSFTAVANGVYIVDGILWGVSNTGTADFKYAFIIPSGTVSGASAYAGITDTTMGSGISFSIQPTQSTFRAVVSIGGAGGTVTFRWAQTTASNTTTLKTSSALSILRVV